MMIEENDSDENPVTLGDALKGYSEGRLSAKEAMDIGGIEDYFELVETMITNDVPFPTKLTPEEERQVEQFTAVLKPLMR